MKSIRRGKKKGVGTRRSKHSPQKITIEVNWDASDGGLSDLQTHKVFKFLTLNLGAGYNLIQTQPDTHFFVHGKCKLHLQAIKVTNWPIKLKWWENDRQKTKAITCLSHNDWIKTPPCGIGMKRAKIFAKLKSNEYIGGFATYLWQVFSGEIDQKKHKEFVRAMKMTFKRKPIFIHNEDVEWFHAKEKI